MVAEYKLGRHQGGNEAGTPAKEEAAKRAWLCPPISCMTLGQILNVSGPQCAHLPTEGPGQHDLWWLLANLLFSGSVSSKS